MMAILAAILFPVLMRGRDKAVATTCPGNVKQISLGVLIYVQDNNERLPLALLTGLGPYTVPISGEVHQNGVMPWMISIFPYVKNREIFTCPAWLYRWNGTVATPIMEGWASSAYGLNWYIQGLALAECGFPSELMMNAESGTRCCYHGSATNPAKHIQHRSFRAVDRPGWPGSRHLAGLHAGFVDGHAKWLNSRSVPHGTTPAHSDPTSRFWNPQS